MSKLRLISSQTGEVVEPQFMDESERSVHASPPTMSIDPRTLSKPIFSQTEDFQAKKTQQLQEQKKQTDGILTGMANFETAMQSFRQDILALQEGQSVQRDRKAQTLAFTRELELITENVAGLNSRVHEVDGLKLELNMLKRRIQRLEDDDPSTQTSHTVTGRTQGTPSSNEYAPPTNARPLPPPFAAESGAIRPDRQVNPKGASQAFNPSANGSRRTNNSFNDPSSAASSIRNLALLPKESNNKERITGDDDSDSQSSYVGEDTPQEVDHDMESEPNHSQPRDAISESMYRLRQRLEAPQRPVSGGRLNNRDYIRIDDPQDDDYEPSYQPSTQATNSAMARHTPPLRHERARTSREDRHGRHSSGEILRVGTPEWEKPGWTDPDNPIHRDVNGRVLEGRPQAKRQKTTEALINDDSMIEDSQRVAFPYKSSAGPALLPAAPGGPGGFATMNNRFSGNLGYSPHSSTSPIPIGQGGPSETVHLTSLTSRDQGPRLTRKGVPDRRSEKREKNAQGQLVTRTGAIDGRTEKRQRDNDGRLLRTDGSVDKRSERYRKKREEQAREKASVAQAKGGARGATPEQAKGEAPAARDAMDQA